MCPPCVCVDGDVRSLFVLSLCFFLFNNFWNLFYSDQADVVDEIRQRIEGLPVDFGACCYVPTNSTTIMALDLDVGIFFVKCLITPNMHGSGTSCGFFSLPFSWGVGRSAVVNQRHYDVSYCWLW